MKKIIINVCYGSFGCFSEKAVQLYKKYNGPLKFKKEDSVYDSYFAFYSTNELCSWKDEDIVRTDPTLCRVVLELGSEASTACSHHIVGEIPDDFDYSISDDEGMESIELIPVLKIEKLIALSSDKEALKEYLTKMQIRFSDK